MLKYVALFKMDEPALWTVWGSTNTSRFFRSPIEDDRSKVEEWLKSKKAEYPNARINTGKTDKKYIIFTSIIAFDTKESKNVELFLENSNYALS